MKFWFILFTESTKPRQKQLLENNSLRKNWSKIQCGQLVENELAKNSAAKTHRKYLAAKPSANFFYRTVIRTKVLHCES